jgi:hypothetical protein
MPIASHPSIGHDLPYRPMHADWHGLVEMAAKRHSHEQQCEAAGRRLSLLYKILKIISLIILIILVCSPILILNYVRFGSPAILEAVISVLGSWRSAS